MVMKLNEFIKKIMSSSIREITGKRTASGAEGKLEVGDIRKLINRMQRNARLDAPSPDISKNDMER